MTYVREERYQTVHRGTKERGVVGNARGVVP